MQNSAKNHHEYICKDTHTYTHTHTHIHTQTEKIRHEKGCGINPLA